MNKHISQTKIEYLYIAGDKRVSKENWPEYVVCKISAIFQASMNEATLVIL